MDSKDPKMSPENYAEMIKEVKNRKDKSHGRTIPEPFEGLKNFEPNPGKAELNEIGKTGYPVFGDMGGVPICQEDIDTLKKSLPLVKKLLGIQRRKIGLDDTSLLTGPDTTENIKEVYEIDDEGMRPADMENYDDMTYIHTPNSDEKIKAAMNGWSKERNTDFPGAKHGEEWLKKHREEQIKDSGDVMFGVDLETQGLQPGEPWEHNLKNVAPEMMSREFREEHYRRKRPEIIIDEQAYPTTEEMKKHIDEQCNKNVSNPEIEEEEIIRARKDFEEYLRKEGEKEKFSYSAILKRMDDTHTRKNNDYGDAAYQGYKKYGDFYFLVQLHNKMSRLESLTVNKKTQMVKDESIDDTLLDMANYAIMFLESRHRND